MRIGALWLLLSCVRPGPACTVIQDSSNVSITRGPWISVHDVDVPHSHQQKKSETQIFRQAGSAASTAAGRAAPSAHPAVRGWSSLATGAS